MVQFTVPSCVHRRYRNLHLYFLHIFKFPMYRYSGSAKVHHVYLLNRTAACVHGLKNLGGKLHYSTVYQGNIACKHLPAGIIYILYTYHYIVEGTHKTQFIATVHTNGLIYMTSHIIYDVNRLPQETRSHFTLIENQRIPLDFHDCLVPTATVPLLFFSFFFAVLSSCTTVRDRHFHCCYYYFHQHCAC